MIFPRMVEIIGILLVAGGLILELQTGQDFAWVVAVAGGVVASYGDMRYRIGKLEGKMELISKSMKVIMKNNKEGK